MDRSEYRSQRYTPERLFEEHSDMTLGGEDHGDEPGPQPPPRSPGWHPPGWLTISLVLILVSLIVALAYLKDEGMPWDGDLAPETVAGGEAKLSAPATMKTMLKAADKLNFGTTANRPPWEWDTPTLGKVLEAYGPVLDNFRDLSEEKEQEWLPTSPQWKAEDMGSDAAWQNIITLKQAEGAYLARRGQEEAAFLATIDLAVMGHLLERLDAWPSFMHRGLELHRSCAQLLAILLQTTQLSELKLRHLQENEFKPWGPSDASVAHAMNGFYRFEKKLIMGPEPGDLPLPSGYVPAHSGWLRFKPRATLRLFAESFRELKDESALIPFARVNQINSRAGHRYRQMERGLGGPNESGEEYFLTRIKDYLEMLEEHSLARARFVVVMNLFAFRRYVAAKGTVPKKLEDLVPEFLPRPLYDPYSNELLKYHPASGIIYSVGEDLEDHGGKPTPIPMSDPGEPTVETGIRTAKLAK